ncbi:MAG: Asp-tRNA(Asn)/Glu-tRNA(Gln) amidotransferase subunit GatA [Candidatus Nealsonbacteria bacterium]|nr:Asp-tRNA(Asn)/Glu-tRNA(Gln) amidotransferase subunit GatA [Candidatus Nealsonbacteria bacterium]
MELYKLNIKETHKGLKEKQFSAVEVAKSYLGRIKARNKDISAYFSVSESLALEQAKKADERMKKKEDISVLTGVPVAIKDNILVEGERITCSSKILEHYNAPYDATVVKKLRSEGAVILGKTNLDEFAMGASTENSGFFPTKNPNDLERVPGGSSGGSAAAVKDDMCCYALGSDTGGSIRQPASFCGVVGLKPTYGAVSRYGLVAFASSLDQIGPLAKTIDDAEIVFNAISGKDEKDSTSVDYKSSDSDISKLRIGVPKEYFVAGIDKNVEKIIRDVIKKYEDAGAEIVEISLPNSKYAIPVYYLICTSEASSNLARYDGIKYGLSENKGEDLLDVYLKSRGNGFGKEVKRRIMLGTYALSAGYYDAYYLKAGRIRTLIKDDFKKAFRKVDVIFSPVAPTPAFKLGEKTSEPLSMYLEDIFTAPVNLAGLPGISIPAGKINNLPVGLQIIGNYFEEKKIFEVAKKIFEK